LRPARNRRRGIAFTGDYNEVSYGKRREHDKAAGKLVNEAKAVDETAVRDVAEELEEDASSEHDPAKLNQKMGGKDPT
jgi:hypothetical protein